MYNSCMRFEVPQFIEVEDKIFGPFTWRQFLYLGGGVGIAVVIFFTTNIFVFVLVGLPIGLLAGALSFYPVNNRPFSFFLEAIFNYLKNYMSGANLYIWKQGKDVVYRGAEDQNLQNNITPIYTNARPKKNIASLARKLELQALQKKE